MAVKYENSEKDGDSNRVSVNVPQSEVRQGNHWFNTCSPQYLFLIIMLVAAVLVSLITLTVFLTKYHLTNAETANQTVSPNLQNSSDTQTKYSKGTTMFQDTNKLLSEFPSKYPADPNVNLTLPPVLTIVARRQWVAHPAVEDLPPLQHPVPYVLIMDTATENCSVQATCTFHVRFLQSYHIDSRGWLDIGYNFLVGGDGYAYEGRGWKSQGSHTLGYNSKSIGIAFIGTFSLIMPPERQITAAKQLIEMGVKNGYIAKDYKLLATRQVDTLPTPGLMLFEELKKWPHWVEKP